VPPYQQRALAREDWRDETLHARPLAERGPLGFTALGEYLPHGLRPETVPAALARTPRASQGVLVADVRRDGSRLTLRASAARAGTVVVPLAYYPFLHARTASGERLRTFSEGGLLGVRLPAGEHAVTVRPGWRWGDWMALLVSLAALAATLVAARWPARRKREHEPDFLREAPRGP
jgi:hypothetical protein